MKVWLVTIGEPLPIDPGGVRLYRAGILARHLVGRGHDVIWWTSSFDHFTRRKRSAGSVEVDGGNGLRIRLMDAPGYRRNISLARIRDHWMLGREFRRLAQAENAPDVILASYPSIELCLEATRFGRERGAPVVIDVRDLWPDSWMDVLPGALRGPGKVLISPMDAMARKALTDATSVIGLTDDYVDWAMTKAGRKRSPRDLAFPLAYQPPVLDQAERERCLARFRSMGVTPDRPLICFFGTIGHQFDLSTVIAAARLLATSSPRIQFAICGKGETLEELRTQSKNCENVVFPGWIGATEIWALMEISIAGLAPYRDTENFRRNLPNKVIEYIAAGLPVLSSIEGELGKLLAENECGVTYRAGAPGSLADEVVRLVEHQEIRARMAANARDLYARRFRADAVYGALERHMESLVGAGDV